MYIYMHIQVMPRALARATPASNGFDPGPAKLRDPNRPPQPANPIFAPDQCAAYIAYVCMESINKCVHQQYLSIYLSTSAYLSVCLSVCLSVYLSIYLYVYRYDMHVWSRSTSASIKQCVYVYIHIYSAYMKSINK